MAEAAALIRSGQLRSASLVQQCLVRIRDAEPVIRAWAHPVDEKAVLARAEWCDTAVSNGDELGVLHGVPVGIKDIVDTHDMPTECGTSVYRGRQPTTDAISVRRLREAGAIVLGKTVTTEMAGMEPSITRNPINPNHTPGGSSSGSAAAVAAGMVPLAVGTQTGGSVIRPASFCGVHALKPSVDCLPRQGIMLQSHTLDTLGFFGTSLDDLGLILRAVGGEPSGDQEQIQDQTPPKFAFWRTPGWDLMEVASQEALVHFVKQLGEHCHAIELERVGRTITEDHLIVQASELRHHYHDLYRDHRDQLSDNLTQRIKSAEDVPAWQYLRALDRLKHHLDDLTTVFAQYDAIICPSAAGPAPVGFKSTGNPIFNGLWTYLGVPCVILPLLNVDGLPLGVQLVAARNNDHKLLRVASWLEQNAAQLSAPGAATCE